MLCAMEMWCYLGLMCSIVYSLEIKLILLRSNKNAKR